MLKALGSLLYSLLNVALLIIAVIQIGLGIYARHWQGNTQEAIYHYVLAILNYTLVSGKDE